MNPVQRRGKSGARPKSGPAKPYTTEEIAHFAEFREKRAPFAPRECKNGGQCWVVMGPPAITGQGTCIGCGDTPKFPPDRDRRLLTRKYPGHF